MSEIWNFSRPCYRIISRYFSPEPVFSSRIDSSGDSVPSASSLRSAATIAAPSGQMNMPSKEGDGAHVRQDFFFADGDRATAAFSERLQYEVVADCGGNTDARCEGVRVLPRLGELCTFVEGADYGRAAL